MAIFIVIYREDEKQIGEIFEEAAEAVKLLMRLKADARHHETVYGFDEIVFHGRTKNGDCK